MNNTKNENNELTALLRGLEAKTLTENLNLPNKIKDKLKNIDPNSIISTGETLLIAVVRHMKSKDDRIKYINLLIESGADVNIQDQREKRTALMYACIEDSRDDEGMIILNVKNSRVQMQDRLGNTALMYAALKGRSQLMERIVDRLSKEWGLVSMQLKNCMGHTAEDLSILNGNHRCARIVQSQRLHLLSCMNRQIAQTNTLGCRHWNAFTALYKCADRWKPRPRRKSEDRNFSLKGQPSITSRKASM